MAWEAVSPIFGPIIETAEKVRVKEEPVRITLPEEEVEDTEEFEETVEESKTKESQLKSTLMGAFLILTNHTKTVNYSCLKARVSLEIQDENDCNNEYY